MNTTKYLQTDSRWSGLGYPKSPCTIGNSGCGEVSIVNAIIEMQAYAKYTPATIQSYCKQYADPSCNGTYWSGIPAMMKHYGLTEVKEHDTMDKLFTELAKGDRVAIYLMGSRKGGTKGVHWTSSGHFVCSVDYKKKDGKNYVYVKDSYSNSNLRNGWITYEDNMKGDVLKVWSGKLSGKLVDGGVVTAVKGTSKLDLDNSKLTVDGIGGKSTVKAMQKFFGVTQDGVIGGQSRKYMEIYPALQSVEFGKGGSPTVASLQKWLGGKNCNGIIGIKTTKAWQKKLVSLGYLAKNETIDGVIGTKTMKAWQECLNSNGKAKTSASKTSSTTSNTSSTAKMPTALFSDFVGTATRMGQATSDERGKTSGGKAGDQTGKEVAMCNYAYGKSGAYHWTSVFRAKNTSARIKIADACIKACNNNHIGYDIGFPDRKSFFKEAKKASFKIDKITANCETTCSELANVCIAAAGLKSYLPESKNAIVDALRKKLASSTEFESVKLNANTLQPGDILVSSSHVAIIVQSVIRPKESSKRVADMQKYLNWYNAKSKLTEDGSYGDATLKAVKAFQEKEIGKGQGDGIVGTATINTMKKVKK